MADHCRKQIRDAVAAYLTANASTVQSVQTARVKPLDTDPLPAVLVLTPGEALDNLNHSRHLSRVLSLNLEIYAKGAATVDTLDAIAKELEPMAVAGVPSWVKETQLTATSIELSGESVDITGVLRLEYDVLYHTTRAAPDTPL